MICGRAAGAAAGGQVVVPVHLAEASGLCRSAMSHVPVEGDGVRGRVLMRFLIVFAVVTGMILAPVVTWPSSGRADGAVPAMVTMPVTSMVAAVPAATDLRDLRA